MAKVQLGEKTMVTCPTGMGLVCRWLRSQRCPVDRPEAIELELTWRHSKCDHRSNCYARGDAQRLVLQRTATMRYDPWRAVVNKTK